MKQIFELLWNSSPLQLLGYWAIATATLIIFSMVLLWWANKHD
ncbi:hypothetical protein OR568_01342 [Lactiplantibacillus plantarum]|nr:hypothetical protein OR568_01342 [Lactiplantibacillus plantarum]